MNYDLIVIGGGPGGISTAIRATLYGIKVLLIEKERLGGASVNLGSIPKKMTYNLALLKQYIPLIKDYGSSVNDFKLNLNAFVAKRNAYIKELNKRYFFNLENANVEFLYGEAKLTNNGVEVGDDVYKYNFCVLATGAKPITFNIDNKKEEDYQNYVKTSDDFFTLTAVPKKAVIIGTDYIAVELASILVNFGTDISIIGDGNQILSSFDDVIGDTVKANMEKAGVKFYFNYNVIDVSQNSISIKSKESGNVVKFDDVDFIMSSIGRDCDLSFIKMDIKQENNYLLVDNNFTTSINKVYAIGDLIKPNFMLAPYAIRCGQILADYLYKPKSNTSNNKNFKDFNKKITNNNNDKKLFLNLSLNLNVSADDKQVKNTNSNFKKFTNLIDQFEINKCVPKVIFCHPPAASVGLSESEARKTSGKVQIFKSQFDNLLFDLSDDENKEQTIIKVVVVDKMVEGMHLVGTYVDEILQGFVVAIKRGISMKELWNVIGIHPTSSEEIVTIH